MSTKTKNTYVALPIDSKGNIISLPKDRAERLAVIEKCMLEQGIAKGSIVFFTPTWALSAKWTGKDVESAGLAKYVSTLLRRNFKYHEDIPPTIISCAFLAAALELGISSFQWKALPNVAKGSEDKQFTFQAKLPSPVMANARHSRPGYEDETGALPMVEGKSTTWYPFVAQDTNVHYFNIDQLKLLVKFSVKKEFEIKQHQKAKQEAADKQFNAAIEAALQAVPKALEDEPVVQVEIRQASEKEEAEKAIEDLEKQMETLQVSTQDEKSVEDLEKKMAGLQVSADA